MPIYTVAQGDCLSSIADAVGFANWRTIYNDPQNAAFRNLRPDPNVIFPGDQLFIPDRDPGEEPGATDLTHTFELKRSPVLLRVVLLDEDHNPLGGIAYKLSMAGTVIEGKAGPDGVVEQTIQPSTCQATLSIKLARDDETGYTWDLQLGALDPETTITGVQARLNNLGYNTGPLDGIKGHRTTDAIKEFQTKYELEVDGIVGPITRAKLVKVHGC